MLAWQQQSGTTETMSWEHRDPSNASVRGSTVAAELEPMGSNAGVFKGFVIPPPRSQQTLEAERSYPFFAATTSGQCVVDGIETPCSLTGGEGAVQCPNNDCGGWNWNQKGGRGAYQVFRAFADGRAGYMPVDAFYQGHGYWITPDGYDAEDGGELEPSKDEFFEHQRNPQNPAPYHLSPDEVNKIRALVAKALASDTCKKFLNDLFAKVTALNPQNPITNRDVLGIFDKIKSQEKGGFFYVQETGRGGHADGSFSLNNAMVFSNSPFSHSPIPVAYQVASTFLNEVLHHIGDNDGTGDISFAQALGFQVPPNLNSLPLEELRKVVKAASGYWHPQVDKACPIHWHPGMR